jgi:uncharacterized protein (DUF885 family)
MNHLQITRRGVNAGLATSLVLAAGGWRAAFAATATPNARLAKIADDYYRGLFELFPMDATENIGDPTYEGRFEIDIAPAHRQRQRRFYQGVLASLKGIDGKSLTRDEQVTRDLLAWETQDRLAGMEFPRHLMPVGHMDNVPVRLAQWAGGQAAQPMKTAANYDHFLARLKKLPAWIDQAIANMQEGIARGIVLPRVLVERGMPQLDALVPADIAQSPYLGATRAFPTGIAERDQKRLRTAYRATVERAVIPAVQRLRTFMSERYLPNARTTSGIGAFKGGADWYRVLVRSSTTTDMTPQQIHDLGLKEVARIRGEMEAVKAKFRYDGDLNTFLSTFESRPELTPFKQESEILAWYLALNEKMKVALPRLFERSPRAPMEVRVVEPMRRDTASDHYVPPAADGSRPGAFYTVVNDPAKYRTTRMTALFLHEGQPGHHYHMALQQELPVPRFRKAVWHDAFGEGWALYAESLGRELGLYEDNPVAYLGRLLMELHRALRLVVDTGLHDKGWTREQTIAYLRENEGTTEQSARRATERYMAWPAQALAYKIGELKILELRERARTRLGPRFDIRAFHTQVLGEGSMPLRMLEAKIDGWIASQK